MNTNIVARLVSLLDSASRALGLRLCYHDRFHLTGRLLPGRLKIHIAPCCLAAKKEGGATCLAYDMGEVHAALASHKEGRFHTCPFGITELAVPVICDGLFCGVLFAGQFWRGRGRPPHPEMIAVRNNRCLTDRLLLLRGVAVEIAQVLREPRNDVPDTNRHAFIIRHLRANLDKPLYLEELARLLALSPSRARHVVRELFRQPFTALVQSIRLDEAAFALSTTDQPIGEIAGRVGYPDQAYFTRVFSRKYGFSPRAYRRRHFVEP